MTSNAGPPSAKLRNVENWNTEKRTSAKACRPLSVDRVWRSQLERTKVDGAPEPEPHCTSGGYRSEANIAVKNKMKSSSAYKFSRHSWQVG